MFLAAFDPSIKSTHAWDKLLLTGLLFLVAHLEPCPVEGTCISLLYENTGIVQDTGRQPVLSSGRPAVAEMQPSQPRTHTAHTRRSHSALGKTRLAGCHSLLEATGQIIATAATHAALSRTFNSLFSLNNATHSELLMLPPNYWKICFKKMVIRLSTFISARCTKPHRSKVRSWLLSLMDNFTVKVRGFLRGIGIGVQS